jgi:hypothetical protein
MLLLLTRNGLSAAEQKCIMPPHENLKQTVRSETALLPLFKYYIPSHLIVFTPHLIVFTPHLIVFTRRSVSILHPLEQA